ncbi:MAG: hypothetical protein U0L09_09525 [Christensenellales bacterium]|nr:hypothetical protein [Christensenellales bacterium]
MLQRMKQFERLRPVRRVNQWNEQVTEWVGAGTICVALSVEGGGLSVTEGLMRMESTCRGLTMDSVAAGDRIVSADDSGEGFLVEFVTEGARYRQLILSRVDALSDVGAMREA